VICPEAYFNRFEGVSNDQPNHISLLLKSVGILVCDFVFDFLHNSNHVNHLAFDPFIFMLPAIIFVFVLRFDDLVLDLLNFVVFLSQSDLGSTFGFVPME